MSKPKFKNGDMVRILDGSKIENYVGHWVGKDDVLIKLFGESEVETMEDHIGKIGTIKDYEEMSGGRIAYTLKEFGSLRWDERGLELISEAEQPGMAIVSLDMDVAWKLGGDEREIALTKALLKHDCPIEIIKKVIQDEGVQKCRKFPRRHEDDSN